MYREGAPGLKRGCRRRWVRALAHKGLSTRIGKELSHTRGTRRVQGRGSELCCIGVREYRRFCWLLLPVGTKDKGRTEVDGGGTKDESNSLTLDGRETSILSTRAARAASRERPGMQNYRSQLKVPAKRHRPQMPGPAGAAADSIFRPKNSWTFRPKNGPKNSPKIRPENRSKPRRFL